VKHTRVDLGQRSESVRRANLSAIVRCLHDDGPQSRSDLVAHTGLTRSAIRDLVGELVESGLATEDRDVHLGRPGRPSPEVSLVPEAAVAAAFFLGVDTFSAAVVGLGGHVLGLQRMDRPRAHSTVDEIVDDLAGMLDTLTDGRSGLDNLAGVGVAVAGVVRSRDGLVETAPNLGWTRVPLGSRLAARLDLDVPVLVANEADLGVLAEHRRGAAAGIDDVLYIHGEVGVGGGLIVGGRPLEGAAGYAGEVGHLPVVPDGAPCQCGSFGCWETEIGTHALLGRAGLPIDAGQEGVDRVFLAADRGDPVALAAIEATARPLGAGLGGLVNIFNPRIVVLGGLCGRIHAYASDAIWQELARRSLPAPRSMVRVVPSMLGADAPLIGAAELALEPVLSDPAAPFGARDGLAELASA
jgi:predicted NBD/HSP70 family sugar kinase